jgi:ParB family chromosome partitioning protein
MDARSSTMPPAHEERERTWNFARRCWNVSRERRLGRGLEALLGRSLEPTADESQPEPAQPLGIYEGAEQISRSEDGQPWLDLTAIDPNPFQPRQDFQESEIADLCDSIREHGFLQPIVIRKVEDRFQIIAGERRFRAAQMASLERIPVLIREVDDREMAELAIVENVQRKDLNSLEKAVSFQRYLQEYGCTQEELAARVNVDRSTVANLIRLLELPEEVKQMISDGKLAQGHARALLPLGDEQEQRDFAKQVSRESLSVRATEQLVHDHIHQADVEPLSLVDAQGNTRPAPRSPSQHLLQIEDQLKLALGAKVDLKQTAKGRGRITIHFKNLEEFERLRAILCGDDDSMFEAG